MLPDGVPALRGPHSPLAACQAAAAAAPLAGTGLGRAGWEGREAAERGSSSASEALSASPPSAAPSSSPSPAAGGEPGEGAAVRSASGDGGGTRQSSLHAGIAQGQAEEQTVRGSSPKPMVGDASSLPGKSSGKSTTGTPSPAAASGEGSSSSSRSILKATSDRASRGFDGAAEARARLAHGTAHRDGGSGREERGTGRGTELASVPSPPPQRGAQGPFSAEGGMPGQILVALGNAQVRGAPPCGCSPVMAWSGASLRLPLSSQCQEGTRRC